MISKNLKPLILSGPSGCGKTTLISHLLSLYPSKFELSVSHTTRPKRSHEKDGFHYYFVPTSTFEKMVLNNEFLEFEKVHGNFYGTHDHEIPRITKNGVVPLLDIDIKGAINIYTNKKLKEANYLFVMTKNIETLKQRLVGRGTENPKTIEIRIKNAWKEINVAKASNIYGENNYIYNEDLDTAKHDFIKKINEMYGNVLI